MKALLRLWRGETPLDAAFWEWAVIVALVVNLSTTFAFVLLVSEGFDVLAFVVGYGFSVPYDVVAAVGVWRAADRYDGRPLWANLARFVAPVWLAALAIA